MRRIVNWIKEYKQLILIFIISGIIYVLLSVAKIPSPWKEIFPALSIIVGNILTTSIKNLLFPKKPTDEDQLSKSI